MQKQFVVYFMFDDNMWDKMNAFDSIDDAWAYVKKCVDDEEMDSNCFEVRCGRKRFSYN